jgi:hypothetical protein
VRRQGFGLNQPFFIYIENFIGHFFDVNLDKNAKLYLYLLIGVDAQRSSG